MTTLPKDPIMLLSFTNMQLRDNYSSLGRGLSALIPDISTEIDKKDIISALSNIDYEYDSRTNQFI